VGIFRRSRTSSCSGLKNLACKQEGIVNSNDQKKEEKPPNPKIRLKTSLSRIVEVFSRKIRVSQGGRGEIPRWRGIIYQVEKKGKTP